MLEEMRTMKIENAFANIGVSKISQSAIWNGVARETLVDINSADRSLYTQTILSRMKTAKNRSESIKFPINTIGLAVVNQEGEIKGLEIHRSPHNFKVRKSGFFTSLEESVRWNSGNKPISEEIAREKVLEVFKKFQSMKEGKEVKSQIEVDGLVINTEDSGMMGKVFTSRFYSDVCPECSAKKKRVSKCAKCGFKEDCEEECVYMNVL